MSDPWVEWWQTLQLQWTKLESSMVPLQLAVLAVSLAVALIVDRLLARYKAQWVGEPPEQHRLRTILWAAKFPSLALFFGYLALAIYSATGRPAHTLHTLVTLFWFVLAYALLAKVVEVLMPPGDARRITRRVLLPVLAVVGFLHITGLLAVLWARAQAPLLTVKQDGISLFNIGLALGLLLAFWFLAKGGKALFLRRVLPRTKTDPNLARSVSTFVQFAIVLLGVWVALAALGVPLSNLTLLVTALSVGIGFGLQDVIKNIMGGMILLSEGHVRPNEVFRIGGDTGVVEQIGLRSTLLRTWDGSQVIVPNADLIADRVADLSDLRRVEVSVGVSCDADPRLAERLLLEIASGHPEVVDDPPPAVFFTNLGESTYDFTLYCWVGDRTQVVRTKSDLHYAVVETFGQHDLEMPYRQLDVHMR